MISRLSKPRSNVVHALLERQAELNPDRIAVISGDEQISYAELNARANAIAHSILKRRLPREAHVGICMLRGPGLVAALFGVLKSGAAFTPLDKSLPESRLRFIAVDSGLDVIVCDEDETLPLAGVTVIDPRRCEPIAANPGKRVSPGQLAYVIYTSGSTGTPKGVMVEHASLCNFAKAQVEAFPVSPDSRVLQFSSFAFDAATSDIVTAIAACATIVCVDRDTTLSPQPFAEFAARHRVDTVTLPPSFLAQLDPDDFPSLEVVVTVGQHCTEQIVERWAGAVRLINGYGPTEATIGTTLGLQSPGRKPHIGAPLANTHVYLLDDNGDPVPEGSVGEISIGGAGVARGYWNRPDLNKLVFGHDPFSDRPRARLVRTFDRARIAKDGHLEILGRTDRVIKLHGQRVDLDDVETNMRSHPGIRSAAVTFRQGPSYDDRLVAFFVEEPGQPCSIESIRQHLTARLPGYMLPHAIHRLDRMPVSISGKSDYAKLEEIAVDKQIVVNVAGSGVERMICDVLKISASSLEMTFIGLGGDSISALRLCNKMRSHWDVRVSTASVLGAASLRELIAEISGQLPEEET